MTCPRCRTPQTSPQLLCRTCHNLLCLARIRVLNHEGLAHAITLPLGNFTLGRFPENDLVLPVEGVSRHHVRLRFAEGVYYAEDCGSKNGLFINGRKVESAMLQDQDCLQIGPVRLLFTLMENATAGMDSFMVSPGSALPAPRLPLVVAPAGPAKPEEEKWREFIAQLLLAGALRLARAGRASLWLPEPSGELGLQQQISAAGEDAVASAHEHWQSLAKMIFHSGSLVLREHSEASSLVWEDSLAGLNCAYQIFGIPLRAQERQGAPAGVLLLENVRAGSRLVQHDAQRLKSLVEQAAAVLAQATGDKALPAEDGSGAGHAVSLLHRAGAREHAALRYDLAYASRPSAAVGGDCLDLIEINAEECVLVIGDVAGKGALAGQMRDRLLACLRVLLHTETRLEFLAQALNRFVHETGSKAIFATLFLGVLHLRRGVLRYVNAGHNPGVMIYPPTATPRFELLRSNGAALGVLEKNTMTVKEVVIPAGATLIFYTDGLTEATGADGKQYGLTRLIECATAGIFSMPRPSAAQLLRLVLEDLPYSAALAAGVSRPEDDQSVLVMIAPA